MVLHGKMTYQDGSRKLTDLGSLRRYVVLVGVLALAFRGRLF